MIYAALGDSITFGENASCLWRAYPALVASMASASLHKPVESYVLAHPGWDSRDLLGAIILEGGPNLHAASVVTIWIGGVDLLEQALPALRNRQSLTTLATRQSRRATRQSRRATKNRHPLHTINTSQSQRATSSRRPLRTHSTRTLTTLSAGFVNDHERVMRNIVMRVKQQSRARIVCCTQYNPFPASPLAVQAIAALNQSTVAAARKCGVAIAPVHAWFEGRQSALIHGYRTGRIEDALSGSLPIHPNDRGHRVIAKSLLPYVIRV